MCYGLPRWGIPQNPSPVWYHKSGVGTIIINQIVVLNTHSWVVVATWPGGSLPLVRLGRVDQYHHRFKPFVWSLLDNCPRQAPAACAVAGQAWLSLRLVVPYYGPKGPASAGRSYWSLWGQ